MNSGACLVFCLILLTTADVSFAQSSPWRLVWEDNFDGPTLDYSKWECEVNAFGGGNHELQLHTDRKENLRVEDGKLILEARRDNPNVAGTLREYSSGRVRTKHRGDWMYGRFEIRAKLPRGQGIWPAIWMLPTAPFDQPFHLILNVAVGGGFVGDPNASTTFPQQMQVDFVRVFARNTTLD